MKVIVVGINHAGTSAIRTLVAQSKEHEIVAYDRNTNISFLGCGIALVVGDVVKNVDDLFYCSPVKLADSGVTVKMQHDVIEVDYKNQKVNLRYRLMAYRDSRDSSRKQQVEKHPHLQTFPARGRAY